jgi:hypothetical protein
MSQTCPNCGASVPPGQRFCNNCGTNMESVGPASQYGGPPQGFPQAQPQQPPYMQPQYGQQPQYQPYPPYQQYQQPQKSSPIGEALGALGLLFLFRRFRPGYRPRRQSSGCCGCLVTLVILLIILGIPGYAIYKANPHVFQQVQQSFNNISSGHNGNSGTVPNTQPQITTVPINQTVTYAGVDITIVSAQQSTAFLDDSSTATNGVVRVRIKESNNSGQDVVYFFNSIAHLLLPDKTSVAPANALQGGGIQNGVTRENWLDFAAPTSDKIAQMTLVLGTTQEAQIIIPLTGKANLSAFGDKKVNLNMPIGYDGLNWMLQSATETLSIANKQASAGMNYIILAFKVDNPTSNDKGIGAANDYMRLKAGGITNASVNSTFPAVLNANSSGATGTVTFLMPQNNSAYTLIFLAAQGYSNVQVNTDFKI